LNVPFSSLRFQDRLRDVSIKSLALKAVGGAMAAIFSFAPPLPALGATPAVAPVTYAKLLDQRRLAFRCAGKGYVTVLFESGFGGDSRGWSKVQNLLSDRYRTCAYDRAGSGLSDPGPLPRDANAITSDLNQSLLALHIHAPLILVGHSSGGLYVRRYAELFPDQVIGLVLVDPSVEYQNRRFELQFGRGAGGVGPIISQQLKCFKAAQDKALPSKDPTLVRCAPPPGSGPEATRMFQIAINPNSFADKISELTTLWTTGSDEVAADKNAIRAIPTIVLTASDTYAGVSSRVRPDVDKLWWSLHDEIVRANPKGRHTLVRASSHLMMLDKPQAVAGAVQELTAQPLPK
jgi:pimeloyl-ACP methyl ester carboxylesterase